MKGGSRRDRERGEAEKLLGVRFSDEIVDTFEVKEYVVHGFRSHGERRVRFGVNSEEDDVANVRAEIGSVSVSDLVVAEEDVTGLSNDLLMGGFELVVVDDGAIDLSGVESGEGAASGAKHGLKAQMRARPQRHVTRHFFANIAQINTYEQRIVANDVRLVLGSGGGGRQTIDLPKRIPTLQWRQIVRVIG